MVLVAEVVEGEVERGEKEVLKVVPDVDDDDDGVGVAAEAKFCRACTSEIDDLSLGKIVAGASSRFVTGPLTRMMCVFAKTDFWSETISGNSIPDFDSWFVGALVRRDCDVSDDSAAVGDVVESWCDECRPVTVITVDVTGGDGGDVTDIDFGEAW